LIVLGALMVLSFIILIALTAMERSRMPRGFQEEDEEEDAFFDQKNTHYTAQPAYHDAPDPEEISYTKRMFAMKDEEPFVPKQDAIRLPAAQVKPSEQPHVIFAPPSRAEEQPPKRPTEPQPVYRTEAPQRPVEETGRTPQQAVPQADQLAQHLVNTARTPYGEAQSSAAYRPVSSEVKPYEPQAQVQVQPQVQPQPKPQAVTPRVFDYKKTAKTQPKTKQTVTRIQKHAPTESDDEE
jgi:hypothetical protein